MRYARAWAGSGELMTSHEAAAAARRGRFELLGWPFWNHLCTQLGVRWQRPWHLMWCSLGAERGRVPPPARSHLTSVCLSMRLAGVYENRGDSVQHEVL